MGMTVDNPSIPPHNLEWKKQSNKVTKSNKLKSKKL